LIGERFGRLTILEAIKKPSGKGYRSYFRCICDCGNEKEILAYSIKRGATKSCGCLHKELARQANTTHGMKWTKFYKVWENMKSRCQNESRSDYKHYGGRGICVDNSWDDSFEKFREDMYESYTQHAAECGEKNTTLDRIDTNGNYIRDNCRWATLSEQAINRRKDKRNKTGVTGVYKSHGKWRAELNVNGNYMYLGVFDCFDKAVKSRHDAELLHFGFIKEAE
jgi:hypothetical protein